MLLRSRQGTDPGQELPPSCPRACRRRHGVDVACRVGANTSPKFLPDASQPCIDPGGTFRVFPRDLLFPTQGADARHGCSRATTGLHIIPSPAVIRAGCCSSKTPQWATSVMGVASGSCRIMHKLHPCRQPVSIHDALPRIDLWRGCEISVTTLPGPMEEFPHAWSEIDFRHDVPQ